MRIARVLDVSTPAEYQEHLSDARAAMFAYLALAEELVGDNPRLFSFTLKAHVQAVHLPSEAEQRGHASYSNDGWVERLLRLWGTRFVR